MSERRLTKRQKAARAKRKQQIMVRVLIAIIAAVCIISVAVNLGGKDKQEDMASADAENASVYQEYNSAAADRDTVSALNPAAEENAASVTGTEMEESAASVTGTETEESPASAAGTETEEGTASVTGTDMEENTAFSSAANTEPMTESSWMDSEYGTQDTSTVSYALNRTVEKAKERQDLLNMNDEDLAVELREREVPEELVEFMEEYPETREFVVDYLFQPADKPSMDISAEVTQGVIPHFLQWDSRWGYEMYGDSSIAVSGCGPTALSEVYTGLTGKTDMNPYEMAQWAQKIGYHIPGEGTAWEMMTTGAYALGLEAWGIAKTEEAMLQTLRDGNPIIAAVAPGDFTYFGHFIVLVSVDSNGNISIRDSNSNIRTQRTWTADELLWQINEMWAYDYHPYQSEY